MPRHSRRPQSLRRNLAAGGTMQGALGFVIAATLSIGSQLASPSSLFNFAGLGSRPTVATAVRKQPGVQREATGFFDGLLEIAEEIGDTVKDAFAQDVGELPQMEVSSMDMFEDGISKNGLFETMSIQAAAGSERRVAEQIARLVDSARTDGTALTATASQNRENPSDFTIFLRYANANKMTAHQTSAGFKDALARIEKHLERPIGLYVMDEQLGQLGMARHPFGPGGEGGRDDAIYSSRKQR